MLLFDCFQLLPHLWSLWELLMTGSDMICYCPSSTGASAVCEGLVSIISPLGWTGDIRPYLNPYESDVNVLGQIIDDRHWRHQAGSKQATANPNPNRHLHTESGSETDNVHSPIMLGVTNPFLLKTFRNISCALFLPNPALLKAKPKAISGSSDNSSRSRKSMSSHKFKSLPPVTYKVISGNESIEDLFDQWSLAGGVSGGCGVWICVRSTPCANHLLPPALFDSFSTISNLGGLFSGIRKPVDKSVLSKGKYITVPRIGESSSGVDEGVGIGVRSNCEKVRLKLNEVPRYLYMNSDASVLDLILSYSPVPPLGGQQGIVADGKGNGRVDSGAKSFAVKTIGVTDPTDNHDRPSDQVTRNSPVGKGDNPGCLLASGDNPGSVDSDSSKEGSYHSVRTPIPVNPYYDYPIHPHIHTYPVPVTMMPSTNPLSPRGITGSQLLRRHFHLLTTTFMTAQPICRYIEQLGSLDVLHYHLHVRWPQSSSLGLNMLPDPADVCFCYQDSKQLLRSILKHVFDESDEYMGLVPPSRGSAGSNTGGVSNTLRSSAACYSDSGADTDPFDVFEVLVGGSELIRRHIAPKSPLKAVIPLSLQTPELPPKAFHHLTPGQFLSLSTQCASSSQVASWINNQLLHDIYIPWSLVIYHHSSLLTGDRLVQNYLKEISACSSAGEEVEDRDLSVPQQLLKHPGHRWNILLSRLHTALSNITHWVEAGTVCGDGYVVSCEPLNKGEVDESRISCPYGPAEVLQLQQRISKQLQYTYHFILEEQQSPHLDASEHD